MILRSLQAHGIVAVLAVLALFAVPSAAFSDDRHDDHSRDHHRESERPVSLFTPPLDPGGTESRVLECHILNASDDVVVVRIQVLSVNDDNRLIRETVDFPLRPFQTSLIAATGLEAPRFCRFIVHGPKNAVRASAVVRNGAEDPVTTAALPAH